jgi:broad specificity phosphatase PhoE
LAWYVGLLFFSSLITHQHSAQWLHHCILSFPFFLSFLSLPFVSFLSLSLFFSKNGDRNFHSLYPLLSPGSVGFYRALGFLPHGESFLNSSHQITQILLRCLHDTSSSVPKPLTVGSEERRAETPAALLRVLHPPAKNIMGPQKTRLILVRHGESMNNILLTAPAGALTENPEGALHAFQSKRVCDPALSPLGWRQALACGDALVHHLTTATTVWISPLQRTLQTAAGLRSRLALLENQVPALRYQVYREGYEHGGCYEQSEVRAGLKPSEIRVRFPEFQEFLPAEWALADRGWYEMAGATARETPPEFVARVRRLIEDIWLFAEQHKDGQTLVLVGHGDLFDMLLTLLLVSPLSPADALGRFVHENTGITNLALDATTRQAYLVELNNAAHLYADADQLLPRVDHRLVGWERQHPISLGPAPST